jgi:hypothetical protein
MGQEQVSRMQTVTTLHNLAKPGTDDAWHADGLDSLLGQAHELHVSNACMEQLTRTERNPEENQGSPTRLPQGLVAATEQIRQAQARMGGNEATGGAGSAGCLVPVAQAIREGAENTPISVYDQRLVPALCLPGHRSRGAGNVDAQPHR